MANNWLVNIGVVLVGIGIYFLIIASIELIGEWKNRKH